MIRQSCLGTLIANQGRWPSENQRELCQLGPSARGSGTTSDELHWNRRSPAIRSGTRGISTSNLREDRATGSPSTAKPGNTSRRKGTQGRSRSAGARRFERITELYVALDSMGTTVAGGDLGRAESLLTAQVVSLNAIYVTLSRRAHGAKYMENFERYLRLGLRAQGANRRDARVDEELASVRPSG